MTRTQEWLLLLTWLSGAASCTDASSTASRSSKDAAALVAELANAEYPLELSPTGRVRLAQGLYEAPAAQDAAAKFSVRLGKEHAIGDLDADGKPEVAVILVAQTGGTGTFSYVAVAQNRSSTTKPVASALLGDRVEVQSLNIRAGELTVKLRTRARGEPMTAAPTTSQTIEYVLHGDKLVAR